MDDLKTGAGMGSALVERNLPRFNIVIISAQWQNFVETVVLIPVMTSAICSLTYNNNVRLLRYAKHKSKVRGYHLDVYQHVNNARYLNFWKRPAGMGLKQRQLSVDDGPAILPLWW